jgi:hypothetical protein
VSIEVRRYGHGSRVPGWDEGADLTKDPSPVPDPATTPVPEELRAEIEDYMAKYPDRRSAAIPALAAVWAPPSPEVQLTMTQFVTIPPCSQRTPAPSFTELPLVSVNPLSTALFAMYAQRTTLPPSITVCAGPLTLTTVMGFVRAIRFVSSVTTRPNA